MANSRQQRQASRYSNIFLHISSTIIILVLSFCIFSREAAAHHAKDYIVVESYDTTYEEQVYVLNEFDFFKPDTDHGSKDNWEYTPTVLYGITDRLMYNFHFHVKRVTGRDPFFEAFTMGLQYRLLERHELPVDIAFSLDYEYPTPRSEDVLDGKDIMTLTGIFSKNFRHGINVTLNLFGEREIVLGEHSEIGWRVGAKGPVIPPLRRRLEAGLEFEGIFDKDPRTEVIPGVYTHVFDGNVIKAGIGFGLTEEADDMSFRAVYLHEF